MHLKLPNGIASHDTFGRVISALAPDAFERCFQSWIQGLAGSSGGKPLLSPAICGVISEFNDNNIF